MSQPPGHVPAAARPRDIVHCGLETLHKLETLPASGFVISCFPHKIRGASAGWTRAVAIFDDKLTAA